MAISDFEHMLISAVRYAIGRRTYIVEITCNYVAKQIPNLSENCKKVMIHDIEHPIAGYGDIWDRRDWIELLKKLKGDDNDE